VLALSLLGLLRLPIGAAADTDQDEKELAPVTVTATRTPELVKDEPLHVETVPAEEIAENLTEAPGDLTALFRELPGIHLQSSAPALGGVRMQLRGMPGRDTLVLTDGLPLLGAQPDAFGLLQTPPLDLAQVEVIKGAASALYGASALGGVLNVVSRQPSAQSSVLVNANSRGGRDASAFLADQGKAGWGGTLTAAADAQSRQDPDDDGWADLPYYQRFAIRPRVWWNGDQNHSLFLTAGFMHENREGGTLPGDVLPDGSPFPVSLLTQRFDAGAVDRWAFDQGSALTGRFSATSNRQDSLFGTERVSSTLSTVYAEEAWSGSSALHRWILGAGFEHDALSVPSVAGVGYNYNVPAVFAQDEYRPAAWVTLAGSARVDVQNVYGTFFSPRLSALLHQPSSPWSVRLSAGTGFSAPTPWVEEVESTSLAALLPLQGLTAERASTASIDGEWAAEGWDVNVSVFTSTIQHPLEVIPMPDNRLELINGAGPRRAPGTELLIGYTEGPLEAIASWAYIDATETSQPGVPHDVPLVPRNTASLDGILQKERLGRIGLELEYTGRQQLEDDPYRNVAPGYFEMNALAEIRLGKEVGLFLNLLNLTNVRQSNYSPLIRPSLGPGGNPITDVWAPLSGRTFNAGLRAEL
jgi:iron complex outermembrane receptor protein